MNDFKTILTEAHKEYPVRIKSVSTITKEMFSNLEKFLKKYRVQEISEIKKTMLQANPLDFGDIGAFEVYIVDAVLGLPISSYVLQQELSTLWSLPEKQVVVRNAYEGMEQLTDQINRLGAIDAEAQDKKLEKGSLLSTSSEYNPGETHIPGELIAGQEYVDNFKDYLSKVEATRKSQLYPSNQGLFTWVKDFKGDTTDVYADDFNKDISGAPSIKPAKNADKSDKLSDEEEARKEIISNWGNLWTTKSASKPFKKYDDFVTDLEIALTTKPLEKVKKKISKGKKNA